MYNVHRNHQGGLYTYTIPIYTFPLGVFQGILSEYLALKCSPIVVYMDLGYFLVTGYVCTHTGGWTPAYPMGFLGGLIGVYCFVLLIIDVVLIFFVGLAHSKGTNATKNDHLITNFKTIENLLSSMKKHKKVPNKIIFASTISVYGEDMKKEVFDEKTFHCWYFQDNY